MQMIIILIKGGGILCVHYNNRSTTINLREGIGDICTIFFILKLKKKGLPA
jgi:hypothetical protein